MWIDLLSRLNVRWFDFGLAAEVFPVLVKATGITVYVICFGFALSLVFGFPLLLMRQSNIQIISRITAFFIEFVRSTPLLVQIYFFFFILPNLGIMLSPDLTGILAITVHYSTYMSEIYRSGMESIPKGQWDAVVALGFSKFDTYRCAILPQVIPPIVPATGNLLIAMFKDSPMLASIGTMELMFVAQGIGMERFQYLEPITICGLIFLILSLGGALLVRLIENRLGRKWLGKDSAHV